MHRKAPVATFGKYSDPRTRHLFAERRVAETMERSGIAPEKPLPRSASKEEAPSADRPLRHGYYCHYLDSTERRSPARIPGDLLS